MNNINNKWREYLSEIDVDPSNFEPKYDLNQRIWQDLRMDPKVRARCLKIVDEFLDSFDIEVEFEDIILTGSIASYHWNDKSDIDLHVMIDYDKIDENDDLLKELFNLKRLQWNKSHEIMIRGHEVELYMQDVNEDHYSLGEFSVFFNKWIKKPSLEDSNIDFGLVEKKADQFAEEIDEVGRLNDKAEYREAYKLAKRIAKRLKKARATALEKDGVMSTLNLVFKALRNADYIAKLMSLKSGSYDKMMSMTESKNNDLDFNKFWKKYNNV